VKSYAEALGKVYAIVGTILAAVPFFRESRLKKARDYLNRAKGETPEDQEVLNFTRATLEAALSVFQPDVIRWMRAALVFAGASFVVDLVVALTK
jgi:hypothetical protein